MRPKWPRNFAHSSFSSLVHSLLPTDSVLRTFMCLVFLMISRLFIAVLWSPAGKGLTFWLLLVMFNVVLLLSHLVSWVRCGTRLYRFLFFAVFHTLLIFCDKHPLLMSQDSGGE